MPDSRKRRDLRGSVFLFAVFLVVALVVATTYYVYSHQPPREPAATNVVFSNPTFSNGNASFGVSNVSGGPYALGGFRIDLVVNDFAGSSVPLGSNESVVRISIGPYVYRITWTDVDGNGKVSFNDTFLVEGNGAPLPSLSSYEFDLRWQETWTAKAFWTTG